MANTGKLIKKAGEQTGKEVDKARSKTYLHSQYRNYSVI